MTDENGTDIAGATTRHLPYGDYRKTPSAPISDRGYTGHRENMSDVGLVYMNARWYSGSLGRFLSADTIVPEPGNPQAYNRYTYGVGNPVRYVDPLGHEYCASLEDTSCGTDDAPLAYNEPTPSQLWQCALLCNWNELVALFGDNWLTNPERGNPVTARLSFSPNVYLTLMPLGASPTNLGMNIPPPIEWLHQRADSLTNAGIAADFLELILISTENDFSQIGEVFMAGIDFGVTGLACIGSGLCYYGRPHPDMPPMFVLSQDIAVTAGDFAAPFATGALGLVLSGGNPYVGKVASHSTDVTTTLFSVLYDSYRASGRIPNMISIGYEPHRGAIYFLVYFSD